MWTIMKQKKIIFEYRKKTASNNSNNNPNVKLIDFFVGLNKLMMRGIPHNNNCLRFGNQITHLFFDCLKSLMKLHIFCQFVISRKYTQETYLVNLPLMLHFFRQTVHTQMNIKPNQS